MRQKKIGIIILLVAIALISISAGCAKNKQIESNFNQPTTNVEATENSTDKPEKLAATVIIATTSAPEVKAIENKTDGDTQNVAKEPTKTTTQPTKQAEPTPTPKPQPKPMQITSPAFINGNNIPAEYTCSASDTNPQINIANVPETTKSLALIMDDPDAPNGTWVHWVVFNIDPKTTVISKNSVPSGTQGTNSWGNASYGGPCPPSGTHRYYFKIYALDTTLSLSSSATKASIEAAMQGHILSQTSLMGKYAK